MKLDITVTCSLNGQTYSLTAKDINDDINEFRDAKKFVLTQATFGLKDLCDKLGIDNSSVSSKSPITEVSVEKTENPSSIRKVVQKEGNKKAEPKVNEYYQDYPATDKQIRMLMSMGYDWTELATATRRDADNLIKQAKEKQQ